MSYLDSMDADEQRRVADLTGLPVEPDPKPKTKPDNTRVATTQPVDTNQVGRRVTNDLKTMDQEADRQIRNTSAVSISGILAGADKIKSYNAAHDNGAAAYSRLRAGLDTLNKARAGEIPATPSKDQRGKIPLKGIR